MNFWWVNHKQTHTAEIAGGYIWSPKKESNGANSEFYNNLTRVVPGDIIFSYAHAKILAVGVVTRNHKEALKPTAFGSTGSNWSDIGWLVPVEWRLLPTPFQPKKYINQIEPLLPNGYSPLTSLGDGSQKCYLASISKDLASFLFSIIDDPSFTRELDRFGDAVQEEIAIEDVCQSNLGPTEKEQLVRARYGQGLFRQRLITIEKKCRLTGVSNAAFLIASHIKPWKDSSDEERLDGNNGLLLAPHVDKLFDQGWISFTDEGGVLVSDASVRKVMESWGLGSRSNAGTFNANQKLYLAYHRDNVFSVNPA